jgi:hypothetical protein
MFSFFDLVDSGIQVTEILNERQYSRQKCIFLLEDFYSGGTARFPGLKN